MHRALLVEDIVARIVQEACAHHRSSNEPENPATVLARTCRAFSEPALDIIWRAPPAHALAGTMRPSIWAIVPEWKILEPEKAKKARVRLSRWLAQKNAIRYRPRVRQFLEWALRDKPEHLSRVHTLSVSPSTVTAEMLGEQFLMHAKRVQRLRMFRDFYLSSYPVDPTVFAAWMAVGGLFPRLRILELEGIVLSASTALAPPWGLLQCMPCITRLVFHSGEPRCQRALRGEGRAALLEVCPRLESLGFFTGAKDDWADGLFDEMIAHTGSLRHFCGYLRPEILWHVLARNRDIAELYFCTDVSDMDLASVADASVSGVCWPQSCPQLRYLTLRDTTQRITLARRLLAMQPNGCLHKCHLYFFYSSESAQTHVADVEDAVRALARHTALTDVLLEISARSGQNVLVPMGILLRPLRALGQLTRLSIACDSSTPLERATFDALLAACPNLQHWSITRVHHFFGEDPPWPGFCVLSFDEFVHILRERPLLETLPVRVNVGQLPRADVLATMGMYAYGPELVVEEVGDRPELCAITGALFPRVEQLWVHNENLGYATQMIL